METISIEKLIDYKILPFDIFDEAGSIVFKAGELLTPGKLMQLKKIETLYRLPIQQKKESYEDDKKEEKKESYESAKVIEKVETTTFETIISPIDEIDEKTYIGPVNINSTIDKNTQIKLKAFYSSIQQDIKNAPVNDTLRKFFDLRNKISNDLENNIKKSSLFSELKLLGEYSKCHDLNVAILASAFGKKYGLNKDQIQDLVLAALLHDIGKKYLPEELVNKQRLTLQEKLQLENHTTIGYNIIKNQLKLPEKIARVALQHHERIDGSGYPNKISEESIDLYSQIIGLCSYFDNLTFNKTQNKVKNVHDALRFIIEKCTKYYSSGILYTFVYMFSYNDIKNFEDMVL